jgi:hypothetical protein
MIIRKPKSTKFMKKWGMRNKVESSGKIEINGISLALRGDQRGKEIRMR